MKIINRPVSSFTFIRRTVPVLIAVAILIAGGGLVSTVRADSVSEMQSQVDSLSALNAQNQKTVTSLEAQAGSYLAAINRLSSQIASLQSQINANQAKQVQLGAEIIEKQNELEQQKKLLGEDLKAMYVSGQMSTVEMLATSNNLSDYVDAATYGAAVQNKIQQMLGQIAELQNELKDQKSQVEQLLVTQKAQQSDLNAKQIQQSQLLAMNQTQQSAYNTQIETNQSKISSLEQKIIEANIPSGGYYGSACDTLHGDTYPTPLCNSGQDSIVDQWGLYNRECVSYVAWKEYSSGHFVPYGLGNAGDWPDNVPGSWIDSGPRAGDAAVRRPIPGYGFWEGGQWVADVGHVMYVEHNNGDGTIAVSQYNASLNGRYSYVSSRTTSNLVFIHFPAR